MVLAAWFVLFALTIYIYLRYFSFDYFRKHGIPHEPPSIPFGNIPWKYIMGRMAISDVFKESMHRFGQQRFHGFYVCHKPILVVHDPELIKDIYAKEFPRFSDRGWYNFDELDFMSDNFVLQKVDKWRRLKGLLTPMFTANQLRRVYPLVVEVCYELVQAVDVKLQTTHVVDMYDMLTRYSGDVVSSLIYGFNYKSLKIPDNIFQEFCVRATEMGRSKALSGYFFPEVLGSLRVKLLPKDVREFFSKIFQDTVEYRRRENVQRNDLMNVFIQLIEKGQVEDVDANGKIEDSFKMTEGIAQAFIFFIAAYETTSLTLTYCLLELAKSQEVQERLRQEVDQVAKSPEGFTFDAIMGMEYMEMVFSEATRKHPASSFASRICTQDYPIPGTSFTVPKGMRVLISPSGLHSDPEHYPDPERFDPSRFNKENMEKRHAYAHIPFGKGPRFCIGQRLGLAQSKQAIASLLREYTFKICDETVLPVKLNTQVTVQIPAHPIFLRVERRIRC